MDPFSEVTPEQRALAESLMTCLHGSFIDAVKERRGDRLKEGDEDELFSGA